MKYFFALIVLVILIIAGYFLLRNPATQEDVPQAPIADQTPGTNVDEPQLPPPVVPPQTGGKPDVAQPKSYVVTYTNDGYAPNSLTIKLGDTVTYKNNSTLSMWPASAMHPSHRVYDGTSMGEHCPNASGAAFDACKGLLPGQSWFFTFNKVGTWRYHDHLESDYFGSVIVE